MLSKAQIKFIRSLHLKKFRQVGGYFIAEGTKVVDELLQANCNFHAIYGVVNEMDQGLFSKFNKSESKFIPVSKVEMTKCSALKNASSVLAIVEQFPLPHISEIQPEQHALFLDSIGDPGNLGTILRSTDWFGMNRVFVSPNTVDRYNPKLIQATMGSIARVEVIECELKEIKDRFSRVIGLDLKGDSLFDYKVPSQPTLFVIGSESHGIQTQTRQDIDSYLFIPGKGRAESLNAAISASILLAELAR